MNKQEAKHQIQKLVEKYQRIAEAGKIKSYNEAQTRNEFIEPLFEFLGWDMRNRTNDNEVTTEENNSGGWVDLAFRFNNIPAMFLEAKAMKIDLDEWKWAEQAINYSWNKSVTWAVLTDFESIKIFNAEIPPKNILQNLFIEIKCQDYILRFDQLWLLSKESFEQKLLDREAQKWGKLTTRKQVGEKLFEDLMTWRVLLTKDFKKQNTLTNEELDEGVQRILDRLIFIRTTEDRKIEQNVLHSILRGGKNNLYKQLVKVFRDFDDGFNSKLFAPHYCEEWKADDKVITEVINGLYETKDGYRYDFSVISSDVLGGIYEQYLSFVQGRKGEEKAKSKRKSQGIYYTPKYIVEYIVKETLGEVLKKTKPKEISNIKVFDPACGSGSFLTASYDKILKNIVNPTLFTKFDILKDNIYGIDLDTQAVEIAQLNLLLKVLSQKTKLPTLQHNLRVGNSLISGNVEKLEKYFGSEYREQKPFNFDDEFKEVFEQGGFDVIIGNPPYVRPENVDKKERNYYINSGAFEKTFGRFDLYILFIEKALKLLKENGYFAFIIPSSFFNQNYAKELRFWILKDFEILRILDLSDIKVFKVAMVQTCIVVIRKKKPNQTHKILIKKPSTVSQIDNKEIATHVLQSSFLKMPQCMIRTDIDVEAYNIIEKIEKNNLKMNNICYIVIGAVPHDSKTGASKDRLITTSKTKETHKKYIEGKDIGRYKITWREIYLDYLPSQMHRPKFPELFENKKLIVRNISTKEGLLAVFDDNRYYTNDTVSLCIPWKFLQNTIQRNLSINERELETSRRFDLKYLLCLINSKLLNFYFKKVLSSNLHVYPEAIRNLPIYNASPTEQEKIAKKAQTMLDLNKELQSTSANTDKYNSLKREIAKFDQEIDEAINKLYGLTNEEIKTIEEKKC
jgi:adenine-specific DNA-methyltransferase